MTTKLTIKDLNCENCPNKKGGPDAHSAILCKIEIPAGHTYHSWVTKKQQEHIIGRGCASHPLALQVLAAPIIGELEGWARLNMQSCLDTKGEALFAVEIGALELKLAELLKEGVKKP